MTGIHWQERKNQQFGDVLVLDRSYEHPSAIKYPKVTYVRCRCLKKRDGEPCGNEWVTQLSSVVNGSSGSCGCLGRDRSEPSQRTCNKCGATRAFSLFARDDSALFGRSYECKYCNGIRKKRDRQRRGLLPEVKAQRARVMKKWWIDNPKSFLLIRARGRAKKIPGLPFSIEVTDFEITSHCPLIGILLKRNDKMGPSNNSPTLDRIVPALGYVKGNVWVISAKANRMKNDASLEELELLVKNLRARMKKAQKSIPETPQLSLVK